MLCNQCGHELADGSKFCTKCGAKQEAAPVVGEAEEIPVVEVPVEEIPVVETPVEEIPVEEIPAEEAPVEEAPAEEAPAEEAPVEEAPAEEAPAEEVPVVPVTPAPKKKKKKGKGCLIVVIIVLLLGLLVAGLGVGTGVIIYNCNRNYTAAVQMEAEGRYEEALAAYNKAGFFKDSKDRAAQLEDMQQRYDQAMSLISEKNFDQAGQILTDLGSYRDCPQLLQTLLPYREAVHDLENAETADQFIDAGYRLAQLGDYELAKELSSEAYLGAAMCYIDSEDLSAAAELITFLNEEDAAVLKEFFSDATVISDLQTALRSAYDFAQTNPDDLYGLHQTQKEFVEKYTESMFLDATLAEKVVGYMDAWTYQDECFTQAQEQYLVGNLTTYLEGQKDRCQAIKDLVEAYGLLENDAQVADYFIQQLDELETMISIQSELEAWSKDAELDHIGNNQYNLVYNKDEGPAFHWTFHFVLYSGDEIVDVVTVQKDVKEGKCETKLSVNIPAKLDADSWRGYWTIALPEEEA